MLLKKTFKSKFCHWGLYAFDMTAHIYDQIIVQYISKHAVIVTSTCNLDEDNDGHQAMSSYKTHYFTAKPEQQKLKSHKELCCMPWYLAGIKWML